MATLESIRSIAERFMKKFEGTPMELKSPIDYEFHYRYPPEDGWISWEEDQPVFECSDCMIEVIRSGWIKPKISMVGPLRVDPNTAGRYWRKSGIYKQREEDEHVRQIADRLLGKKANPWDVGQMKSGQTSSGAQTSAQIYRSVLGGNNPIINQGVASSIPITNGGQGHNPNMNGVYFLRESRTTMWVNENLLKSNKKAEQSPDAPQERKVWGQCPDCGKDIYEMSSYWEMPNAFVCIDCWLPYYEKGIGFHSCAGLDLGIALEG